MYSIGIVLGDIKKYYGVSQEIVNLLPSLNTGFLFCSGKYLTSFVELIDFFFNIRECNLHSEFMIFFDLLRKNKLNECIVSLRRIRKNNQYVHFQEPSFKKRLKKIEKNVKNKINDINDRFNLENYTISMKN